MAKFTHDVITIGAGAAGLTAAGGCAMLGLKSALIERGKMGGDCLNYGCVPSKAILTAGAAAQAQREAARFGIAPSEPVVDFAAVMDHVHGAIKTIEPHDSVETFTAMGVDVRQGEARLTGPKTVEVNGTALSAPRIVLAVGSKPFVPPIRGIDTVPYLTSNSLWELRVLPEHLVIVGTGPIGMEMAQAFRRLGSQVTIIGDAKPFIHDDPEAAAIVIERIASEGVRIVTDSLVTAVEAAGEAIIVHFGEERITASHLLIAAGRTTDFSGLGLEAAGVAYDRAGIIVDARRRTSAKHIYAIGDCRPGPHFTHASGYEGSNIALEVGLGLPTKADYRALPWVTYTDPELAQVGMTEAAARKKYGDKVRVFREDFDHNDRAIAEGDTAGFVKIVKAGGKLVGATIVGAHAGDHVLPWAMAITGKASLFGMASLIVPYPNRTEHDKAAAFATQNDLVFNRWSRGWAGFLAGLRRRFG